MSNIFIRNTMLFIAVLLLQLFVFNNISYLGYVNPMVYLLFVILTPYRENKIPFLFSSFLLGLLIDIFSNTGGIHAASTVFIAYLRAPILIFVFGKNFDFQEIKIKEHAFSKVFMYVTMLTLLHHTLFYFFEIFNFNHLISTLAKISLASVFTILVCLLFIYLFSRNKK